MAGCGFRPVATDTSVKPSAEPASMRPASNRAMPVRTVASSRPVSRASPLACGSAHRTHHRTRWRVGATRHQLSFKALGSLGRQRAPCANPARARMQCGSPPASNPGTAGCVSRCAGNSGGGQLGLDHVSRPVLAECGELGFGTLHLGFPPVAGCRLGGFARQWPRHGSTATKPTADVIDQATQPSHSTSAAMSRTWKRLPQRLSANNGAAILKMSAATLATA